MLQESDLKETDGLYPCAYETIWSVRDVEGIMYLDMTLNQSNDYIMAGYIIKDTICCTSNDGCITS
jgi:thymidylate synthase